MVAPRRPTRGEGSSPVKTQAKAFSTSSSVEERQPVPVWNIFIQLLIINSIIINFYLVRASRYEVCLKYFDLITNYFYYNLIFTLVPASLLQQAQPWQILSWSRSGRSLTQPASLYSVTLVGEQYPPVRMTELRSLIAQVQLGYKYDFVLNTSYHMYNYAVLYLNSKLQLEFPSCCIFSVVLLLPVLPPPPIRMRPDGEAQLEKRDLTK